MKTFMLTVLLMSGNVLANDTPTATKMHIISTCVAALETVAFMMDEQGKPTLAKIFREFGVKYDALWVSSFPDVDAKTFNEASWDQIRGILLEARDEGTFDKTWAILVNDVARPCMEEIG